MSYNIKSIKKCFKDNGVFYTPSELALLMKSYVSITPKNVYDPTCGDGALLSVFDDNVPKYGQEINQQQLEVANKKLVNFTGVCGDTLQNPAFKDQKFSLIMANPPFSIKWNPNKDERLENYPALPPPSKADYAFIAHILHYLSDNGEAIVLCFPGILYRGNAEGKIRQFLIERNYIDRVVSIPGGYFIDTNIATNLIVLRKNKQDDRIVFEDKENNIIKEVNIEEIRKNDYNLSINNYIQIEVPKENVDPIELEKEARYSLIKYIKAQLDFSKFVSSLSGIEFQPLINDIQKLIDSYK